MLIYHYNNQWTNRFLSVASDVWTKFGSFVAIYRKIIEILWGVGKMGLAVSSDDVVGKVQKSFNKAGVGALSTSMLMQSLQRNILWGDEWEIFSFKLIESTLEPVSLLWSTFSFFNVRKWEIIFITTRNTVAVRWRDWWCYTTVFYFITKLECLLLLCETNVNSPDYITNAFFIVFKWTVIWTFCS